ncbi:hypothetical protein L1765_14175, partial [Microaerobacter geothermalis]|nr:hypothetical protein [Microaerobacter geothermalis]
AASKTRTYLGSKYWALSRRRGQKKATIAIAHKILVIVYHILFNSLPGHTDLKMSSAWYQFPDKNGYRDARDNRCKCFQ